MKTITIDPVTRIEGHLKIEVVVDGGVVKEARSSGTLFRGFEIFLRGRDPRDAARMTQRVCGVCPVAHATASALALDEAFGLSSKVPPNGRILRNMILGSNFLQSHILHFYALSALDYVDVAALDEAGPDEAELRAVRRFLERGQLGPFVPRYKTEFRLPKHVNRAAIAHYVKALEIRRICHEMIAIFGGRMPLQMATFVGGVLSTPTDDGIAAFLAKLARVRDFVKNAYLPDILAVAKAYPEHFELGRSGSNFLAYGAFDQAPACGPVSERKRFFPAGAVRNGVLSRVDVSAITEDVARSFFTDDCAAAPGEGKTEPAVAKEGAYSFLKAPRYGKEPFEVGPLARTMVAYLAGAKPQKETVDGVLAEAGLRLENFGGTLGRHASRAIEAALLTDALERWAMELVPGEPACAEGPPPKEARGVGLTDAPRGALGHWLEVGEGKIKNYQLVVPTTWNASPRDAAGRPGPIESALVGAPVRDEANPTEVVRIVRSFDPCLACAVHVVGVRRDSAGDGRVVRVA